MNKLQQFIQSKPGGFLRDADMPALIALDRLCQVLVRCGGCRFTCAAQDVKHLIACLESGGDYVRDVSFPVGSMERAASWKPEPTQAEIAAFTLAAYGAPAKVVGSFLQKKGATHALRPKYSTHFNENDCGGAFDGNQVTSDADPGL